MKKPAAIFFLLLFSLQSFYATGFVAWFYINRARVAREHCVNKNRPELHCNGSCFLSKKLKEAEQKQDEEKGNVFARWVEIGPCALSQFSYSLPAPESARILQAAYTNFYRFRPERSIFHPPGA